MIDGWVPSNLGAVCSDNGTIQTGPFGSQLHAEDYSTEGVPVIMPTNIGPNRISESGIARVSHEHVERLSRHKVREGDIVYSRRGDITKRALIREREVGWLCGTGCLLVRPGRGVDPVWLSYWLGTPDVHEWLMQRAVGATMPNLNTGILSELPVLLPPLDEQRRIAGVLGALDDLIEVNRGLARNCEQLAQSLASTPSATTALSSFTTWGGLPTVKPTGTIDHYSLPAFDDGQNPERVDGYLVKSNKQHISQPCVLVARLNPHIPRVWMVYPDPSVSSLASTEFVPIHGDGVPDEVVYAVCSAPTYLVQMNGLVTGTTGSHQRVGKDALTSVEVPDVRRLPAETLEAISLLVKQANALRVEIRELSNTRDELLPLLMSGRVGVRGDGVAA